MLDTGFKKFGIKYENLVKILFVRQIGQLNNWHFRKILFNIIEILIDSLGFEFFKYSQTLL